MLENIQKSKNPWKIHCIIFLKKISIEEMKILLIHRHGFEATKTFSDYIFVFLWRFCKSLLLNVVVLWRHFQKISSWCLQDTWQVSLHIHLTLIEINLQNPSLKKKEKGNEKISKQSTPLYVTHRICFLFNNESAIKLQRKKIKYLYLCTDYVSTNLVKNGSERWHNIKFLFILFPFGLMSTLLLPSQCCCPLWLPGFFICLSIWVNFKKF